MAATWLIAGCSPTSTPMLPTEYISFRYTVTPPGTGTGDQPMTLTVAPELGLCDRVGKTIKVVAAQGVASTTITLKNSATAANQPSLNIDFRTKGIADVDFQLPLAFDDRGVGKNPAALTTTDMAQALSCNMSINSADPFVSFDGTFQCTSSASATPRRLELIEGKFHAAPCPALQ